EKWVKKAAKTSPLIMRMGLLVMIMICGVYICNTGFFNLVKLKSNAAASKVIQSSNIQINSHHCPQLQSPFLHYPKPLSFNREECECNPIRLFAIFSMQRSGSGWFETMLNNHKNVSSNGEIFSVKERRSNASIILKTLDQVYNMDWFTSASKNECSAAVGLKWMLNQGLMQYHEEIVKYMNKKGVSAIFLLRRNLLRRMVSVLANSHDRNAKLLNGTHKSHVHSSVEAQILASYRPKINATEIEHKLKLEEAMITNALEFFNSTRHIIIYYEDLISNGKVSFCYLDGWHETLSTN
ncbi:Nodulation protein H, partial [Bienertia sinuspersici]